MICVKNSIDGHRASRLEMARFVFPRQLAVLRGPSCKAQRMPSYRPKKLAIDFRFFNGLRFVVRGRLPLLPWVYRGVREGAIRDYLQLS
jgi:hypothetical protein